MEQRSQYYYQQMNREEQSVYQSMYTAFTQLARSARILKLAPEQLGEIFFQLRLDHPEIFYVSTFSYQSVRGADYAELIPEYLFDRGKVKTHQQAIESRVTRILRPILEKSPLEQEVYIHDFICENVRYDKLKKSYSHEVIGPLTQGVGVCEGIAKTVKLLCDRVGLECIIPISAADPEHGVKYRHAWNILKLNGKYYHLDATFDNSLGRYGTKRYDYFNLEDKKLFRDHRPLLYPAPACTDGDQFYYKVHSLSWTKVEDVEKRVLQAIRKKKPVLVFHWRGGFLTREVLSDLAERIHRTVREKELYAALSVNYAQAVLQITFTRQPPETQLEAESADEGEEL